MARVYKAYDSGLQRVVALKVPLRQYATDEVFVERFLREARTAAKLDHPNIITIFDVGEQGGIPYFTMQYVDHIPCRNCSGNEAPCHSQQLYPWSTRSPLHWIAPTSGE